jgi:hypothetical protein
MRQLRADGLTDNAIASVLNGESVATKRGGQWRATTVWRILSAGEVGDSA